MTGWRSTRLKLASEHCSAALRYADEGRQYDRSIFAPGTAAHAVLEDLGVASVAAGRHLFIEESEPIARMTCERLISEGRVFDGERESPLPPAAVWEGRDLALAYQREAPRSPGHRYEIDLAVTKDWIPCPPTGEPWLKAKIDELGTDEADWWEDGPGGSVLVVADFKSGWHDDEAALGSLQRKIQAVLSWLHYGEGHEALRLVIVNFRLRREYDLVLYPRTEEGAAVLARWQGDIVSEIRRAEADPERRANPGAGCLRCPYLGSCEPARRLLSAIDGVDSPEAMAAAYAVAEAVREALAPKLKLLSAEAPIPVYGGFVGTQAKETRILRAEAPQVLADLWNRRGRGQEEGSRTPGLLQALALGVANVEGLLRHMFKEKEDRERRAEILRSILTTKVRREFGVHGGG